MKNAILRLSALLTAVCLLAGIPLAYAADGFESAYTYTYDYWEDLRHSPDAYRPLAFLTSANLGLETPMNQPKGLFVQDHEIYIVDTGNHRILHLHEENNEFTLVGEPITQFTGEITDVRIYDINGKPTLVRVDDVLAGKVSVANVDEYTVPANTFNAPSDIYVDAEGTMYIADTENNRVVKLDKDLNYIRSFVQPVEEPYDQSKSFLPSKLVADTSGRVFCLATNVNQGVMKFEANGVFTAFIGAAPVKISWYEIIWRLLSTKEQRAQQASAVATEYDNICIDDSGFFYVVTQTFEEADLMTGAAEPVRRLNTQGTNILIDNGTFPPIGDIQWAGGDTNLKRTGPSLFVDVTVLENDIYVALDEKQNRLFGYDKQGNMLWAFGGVGTELGYFNKPSAIEHMGNNLLVLDSLGNALTVMTPTEYGDLIFTAIDEYNNGDYEGSANTWQKVLERNGNYDLAYIGVGRAEMQRGNYKTACDYFKMARDEENYSKAFQKYRSELVKDNIGWIFGIVAVVLVVPPVLGKLRKIKWEVDNA